MFEIHPAPLCATSVVGRFADITLGTRRLHRRRLRFLQHPDYFLFTEPTSLHFLLLLLLEQNYTFQLPTFRGSGHMTATRRDGYGHFDRTDDGGGLPTRSIT